MVHTHVSLLNRNFIEFNFSPKGASAERVSRIPAQVFTVDSGLHFSNIFF